MVALEFNLQVLEETRESGNGRELECLGISIDYENDASKNGWQETVWREWGIGEGNDGQLTRK